VDGAGADPEPEAEPVWQAFERQESALARHVMQFLGSLVFTGIYVLQTYGLPRPGTPACALVEATEVALCAFFAADYADRLAQAGDQWVRVALAPLQLVELITFFPTLLELVLGGLVRASALMGVGTTWAVALTQTVGYLGVLRVFRLFRVLRLGFILERMRASRSASVRGGAGLLSPVVVESLQLAMTFFVLTFFSASVIQIVEDISFHKSVWFVWSTLTTVGYGDVLPQTLLGKLASVVMIGAGVVLLPLQAARIAGLFGNYRVAVGLMPPFRKSTVLLATRLHDIQAFKGFFYEFFNSVRKSGPFDQATPGDTHLLCVCNRPAPEFKMFQEAQENRLTLFEGSFLADADLERVAASSAESCVIRASRYCSNPNDEDLSVLFQTWAFKSYAKCPLVVQTLTEAGRDKVKPFLEEGDRSVSLERMRHNLTVLGALCPGSLSLLGNLARSMTPLPKEFVDPGTGLQGTFGGRRWFRDYIEGVAFEMYSVPFHSSHFGQRFADLAMAVYQESGSSVVLIGVHSRYDTAVEVNPDLSAVKSDCLAVVLAASEEEAQAALAEPFDVGLLRGLWKSQSCEIGLRAGLADAGKLGGGAAGAHRTAEVVLSGDSPSFEGWVRTLRRCDRSAKVVVVQGPNEASGGSSLGAAGATSAAGRQLFPLRFVESRSPSEAALVAETEGLSSASAWVHLSPLTSRSLAPGGPRGGLEALSTGRTQREGGFSNTRLRREALEDAEALLVAHNLHSLQLKLERRDSNSRPGGPRAASGSRAGASNANPSPPHAVVDLSRTESHRFLNPNLAAQGARFNRLVKSGPRFSFASLKSREQSAREIGAAEWQCNPFYANGMVLLPAVLDNVVCQCLYSDVFARFLEALVATGGRGPSLRQLPVPPQYDGRSYSELFKHCAAHGLVAVGLYRKKTTSENLAGLGRYSVCCPKPDTILASADRVFVLFGQGG